jgi:hypothetical protein
MNKDEILTALEPVIKAFDELGISYYVGGSVASSVYGIARTTMDIDLISNLNQYQVKPLVQKLKPYYFIDEDMILDAIKSESTFNLIHLETMIKIDVFILKEKYYDKKVFERKHKDIISDEPDSIQVYLCSAEDIILNKLIWFESGGSISENQWKDIIGVIKVQDKSLNKEYLETWAKELGISDLLNKAMIDAKK